MVLNFARNTFEILSIICNSLLTSYHVESTINIDFYLFYLISIEVIDNEPITILSLKNCTFSPFFLRAKIYKRGK